MLRIDIHPTIRWLRLSGVMIMEYFSYAIYGYMAEFSHFIQLTGYQLIILHNILLFQYSNQRWSFSKQFDLQKDNILCNLFVILLYQEKF